MEHRYLKPARSLRRQGRLMLGEPTSIARTSANGPAHKRANRLRQFHNAATNERIRTILPTLTTPARVPYTHLSYAPGSYPR